MLRLTIGKKLNALILTLEVLSIGGAILLATQLFTSDLTGLLRKGTLDSAVLLSSRVRSEMKDAADRARTLAAASLEDFRNAADRVRFIQDNLSIDSRFLGLGLYQLSKEGARNRWRMLNSQTQTELQLPTDFLAKLDAAQPLNLEAIQKGLVEFKTAKIDVGPPVLRMAIPFVKKQDGSFSQFLVFEMHLDKLASLFRESSHYTSFLLDRNGIVLGATDPLAIGKNLASSPMMKSKQASGQVDFTDESGEVQMAAYQSVGFSDLKVFSQVPLSRATQAQKTLYRRTGLLAGFFVFIALFLAFWFSQGITRPITALANAAEKIKQGDFSVRLNQAKENSGDEIQRFSNTFNEMVGGLQEREKIKSTFAKFHSQEVADKILSGELKLGGERKDAVVFFSDVRGFTALSEKMDPEKLVSVLNRYMSRMVRIIIKNGGIVDKYVGDAIMAVWGVPLAKPDDAYRSIRACLEMREELARLNQEFKSEGIAPLKIGMGVNHGPLISGNIGSEERMEFTVIGDTVNTASRIESLTKSMGTDLLISQSLVQLTEGRFMVEKAHSAKVKGKADALVIYKVHGYYNENKELVSIETPYSHFAPESSDKVLSVDSGSVSRSPNASTPPPPPKMPSRQAASEMAIPPPPSIDRTRTEILQPLVSLESEEIILEVPLEVPEESQPDPTYSKLNFLNESTDLLEGTESGVIQALTEITEEFTLPGTTRPKPKRAA